MLATLQTVSLGHPERSLREDSCSQVAAGLRLSVSVTFSPLSFLPERARRHSPWPGKNLIHLERMWGSSAQP